MTKVGYSYDGPPGQESDENALQYQVNCLPQNEQIIRANTAAEDKTWAIIRQGQAMGTYPSAEAALTALEKITGERF